MRPNGLFLGSTNPRQSMMTVAKHGMSFLILFPLIHGFYGPIPISRQDLGSHPKKVYPWGVPPRVSSRGQSSHVISLHQSVSLIKSLNHVARSVWAHSSLIRQAIQDGKLTPVHRAVLRSDCDGNWDVEDSPPPAHGPWVVPCAV